MYKDFFKHEAVENPEVSNLRFCKWFFAKYLFISIKKNNKKNQKKNQNKKNYFVRGFD